MIDTKGRVYFKNLDALRCLAAFMVVFLHIYEGWHGYFSHPDFIPLDENHAITKEGMFIDTFFRNGSLGVDIFFLISGFLITYLLIAEKTQTGTIHVKFFYFRRMLRIWPLYFFILIITPFVISWLGKKSPDYLPNIFFLNNFLCIATKEWTYPFSHLWSICIEEHFYIFWPLLISVVPFKRLSEVLIGIVMISIFYRFYIYYTNDNWYFKIYLHTISRMDALAIGGLAAIHHFKKPFGFEINRLPRVMLLFIAIFLLVIDYHFNWEGLFLASFKKYIYLILFGYLMLNFSFNSRPLINPPFWVNYLGKISYGIYMYSNILVTVIAEKIMIVFELDSFLLFAVMNIAFTILISAISYEFFEKHFLKLKTKFELVSSSRTP
jgi:peptidoglycan/LPS O-acetylase OafA/YrhL